MIFDQEWLSGILEAGRKTVYHRVREWRVREAEQMDRAAQRRGEHEHALHTTKAHTSSPPVNHLRVKLRSMETETLTAITEKVTEEVNKAVHSAEGIDDDQLKAIALDQIKQVYKPRLTEDEYQKTFEDGHKWEDYRNFFDQDWLSDILEVGHTAVRRQVEKWRVNEVKRAD